MISRRFQAFCATAVLFTVSACAVENGPEATLEEGQDALRQRVLVTRAVSFGAVAHANGKVYFGSEDRSSLVALDPRTGVQRVVAAAADIVHLKITGNYAVAILADGSSSAAGGNTVVSIDLRTGSTRTLATSLLHANSLAARDGVACWSERGTTSVFGEWDRGLVRCTTVASAGAIKTYESAGWFVSSTNYSHALVSMGPDAVYWGGAGALHGARLSTGRSLSFTGIELGGVSPGRTWGSAVVATPSAVYAINEVGDFLRAPLLGGAVRTYAGVRTPPNAFGQSTGTAVYDIAADSTGIYVADTDSGACPRYAGVRKFSLSSGRQLASYPLPAGASARPSIALGTAGRLYGLFTDRECAGTVQGAVVEFSR